MDTNSKIKEVKSEYKAYLTQKHPEWAESTVGTHVSDAFYIWNNSLVPGFWKALQSDVTMENARKAIEEYIKTVKFYIYKIDRLGYLEFKNSISTKLRKMLKKKCFKDKYSWRRNLDIYEIAYPKTAKVLSFLSSVKRKVIKR